MDLESEESTEKDEFFEECLNDPTLRDQMSILTRKFRNKTQVVTDDKMLHNDSIITIDPVVRFLCIVCLMLNIWCENSDHATKVLLVSTILTLCHFG